MGYITVIKHDVSVQFFMHSIQVKCLYSLIRSPPPEYLFVKQGFKFDYEDECIRFPQEDLVYSKQGQVSS